MELYIIIKFIHILSAALMIGGSTANGIMEINLKKNKKLKKAEEITIIINQVNLINTKIVFPTLVLLLISGVGLTYIMDIPLLTKWIFISLILFAICFAIYFIGKHNEDNLEKMAVKKDIKQMEKSHRYILIFGPLASVVILTILYLMIRKPI